MLWYVNLNTEIAMRLYTFTNMYLSSLQVGLQSAHVLGEMHFQYEHWAGSIFDEWAYQHKTIIILNGGYSSALRELVTFFNHSENPYPWAEFCESDDALDGALTATGIILPEKIYDCAAWLRTVRSDSMDTVRTNTKWNGEMRIPSPLGNGTTVTHEITKWEFQLIEKLNTFNLAK